MVLPIIAAIAIFVAVVALILAITSGAPNRGVERRLAQLHVDPEGQPVENILRSDSGTFPVLRRFLTGSDWSLRAAIDLAQAGSSLKVSEYLLMRIFVAVGAVLAAVLLSGGGTLGFALAIAGAIIGFMAPALWIKMRQSRRQDKITAQLPEALALISNSLRSGFAFTQAVELAAKQIDPPIADELQKLLRDVSLGAPTDVALQEMATRIGSYDLEMMVSTILIQRNTGGNLSEILDNVAETVRERQRLQNEIKALTASQRLTGLILSIYPVLLFFLFTALVPDLMSVLWQNEVGRVLLALAAVLQVIGMLTIRQILKLEV